MRPAVAANVWARSRPPQGVMPAPAIDHEMVPRADPLGTLLTVRRNGSVTAG
jgi:hypothetical protein